MSTESPLKTPTEAAEFLRTKERTLERWRHDGGGPAFIKIGRRVVYRLEDLDSWVARQRRRQSGSPVASTR